MRRIVLGLFLVLPLLAGCTGVVRQSVSSDEVESNQHSWEASVSNGGNFVAFSSDASNLVAGDTNGVRDVFVRDTSAGTTSRISVSTDGTQGNAISRHPSVSADGRYVAFESEASNLVDDDENGVSDVFVHDRVRATTRRVSVSKTGRELNGQSFEPRLAAGGGSVVFKSWATNLVAGARIGGVFVAQLGDTKIGITAESGVDRCPEPPTQSFVVSAALSGDGSRLVYHLYCEGSYTQWVLVVRDIATDEEVILHSRSYSYSGPRPVAISANGSVVAVTSYEAFYVRGQVYEVRRLLIASEQGDWSVSETEAGVEGNTSLSADGRYLAVSAGCAPGVFCAKVLDRDTGRWHTASVGTDGSPQAAWSAEISPDGSHVAFISDKALTAGDANEALDVFTRPMGRVLAE